MTEIARRAAAAMAVLLMVPAIVVIIARLQGGRPPTPWPQLVALVPFGTLAAVLALGLASVTGKRLLVLAATLPALALVGVTVLPCAHWGSPAAAAAAAASVPLTVMTVNAHVGRASPDEIVAAVNRYSVDLLAVQELTPPLAQALSAVGLGRRLPFSLTRPRPVALGSGLWSRYPISQLPDVAGTTSATPRGQVALPNGTRVTVTVVHPISPRPQAVWQWHQDLGTLLAAVRATSGPQLVVGDFNATRHHAAFRAFLAQPLVDAADATGTAHWPGWTWPESRYRTPFVRLDHVLASPEAFTVDQVLTPRIQYTDHRPVIARLRVTPRAEAKSGDHGLAW